VWDRRVRKEQAKGKRRKGFAREKDSGGGGGREKGASGGGDIKGEGGFFTTGVRAGRKDGDDCQGSKIVRSGRC